MTQNTLNDPIIQQELEKHLKSIKPVGDACGAIDAKAEKPTAEPAPTDAASKSSLKFEIELTPQQVAILVREAATLSLEPKEHLLNQIDAKIFQTSVGRTLISKPSKVSGISTSHIRGAVRNV